MSPSKPQVSTADRVRQLSAVRAGQVARDWLARGLRLHSSMWSGDYPDWAAAQAACRPIPIDSRRAAYEAAIAAVERGEAAYERDGLPQSAPRWDWPLLTALAELRASGCRRLTVLDVGGGLASSFRQHRDWLAPFDTVRWQVVEMPAITASGRQLVTDPRVEFHDSIAAARADDGPPDLVLASGLGPLVPDPAAMIAELADTGAGWVFLDRIPVLDGLGRDLLTRQVVHPSIYRSESPFWFFDPERLNARLAARFRIAGEWTSACDRPVWVHGRRCRWLGFLLRAGGA